jgi:hypothetical protein
MHGYSTTKRINTLISFVTIIYIYIRSRLTRCNIQTGIVPATAAACFECRSTNQESLCVHAIPHRIQQELAFI